MVILNEWTGQILLRKVFPTWNAFSFSDDLLWWLKRIQKGRLVLMFVQKSGTYGLKRAIKYMKECGSLFVEFLPPSGFWIWVWINGGKTLLEAVSSDKRINKDLWTDIFCTLSDAISIHFKSAQKQDRVKFCQSVEGMGKTCSFGLPDIKTSRVINQVSKLKILQNRIRKLFLEPSSKIKPTKYLKAKANEIGIVVCAGSRYQYLNEALQALFNCTEIDRENIIVVVGIDFWTKSPNLKTIALLNMLNLTYHVVLQHLFFSNNKIPAKYLNFMYYKQAWSTAVEVFSTKKYLAFVDEDVAVRGDWMRFILHTAPLLQLDSTLWCITGSAANVLGKSSNKLARGWRQVGWGFLLLREEVIKAVQKWPTFPTYSTLFDSWLLKEVTGDRECVFPSISHTHHFGIGLNIIPELHEKYFIDEPLSPGNTFNYTPIKSLIKENYERFVHESVKNAKILKKDPCALGFLEELDSTSDYVFYFALYNKWDAPEWTFLSECIGTWPYSTHGMHKGSMAIPLQSERILWLVGVPLSPYSIYKPPGHPVWEPGNDEDVEKQIKFTNNFYHLPNFSNRSLKHAELELFH